MDNKRTSNKVEVKCSVCHKTEFVSPCRAKKYKTCSLKCMGQYSKMTKSKKVTKVCTVCGKEYKVKPSQVDRSKYCSLECMHKDLPRKYSGEGNPNYKNRLLNDDGYKKDIVCPKYTMHRETVKRVLNIEHIPSVFIVHHKDGNKLSNNPENLILLTHKEHTWLHKNIGNFVFKALYSGKLSIDDVLSWVDDENKEFVRYALTTNCTQQSAVVKQGELLENPEMDNQQPSFSGNTLEGSTTNTRYL